MSSAGQRYNKWIVDGTGKGRAPKQRLVRSASVTKGLTFAALYVCQHL